MTEVYISMVDLSIFRTKGEQTSAVDSSWKIPLSRHCPGREIETAKSGNGKPLLLSPRGWHYNLSHSGDLGVSVLTEVPVGVDIEIHRRNRNTAGISREYFHSGEIRSCLEDPSRFFELWTRKEAWIKLKDLTVWHLKESPDTTVPGTGLLSWRLFFRDRVFSLSLALEPPFRREDLRFIWTLPPDLLCEESVFP